MFEVRISSEFSAAHSLRHYKGKCEELHGHNWKVEAVVCGKKLDKIGMLVDFKELKSVLSSVINTLDHQHLNCLPYFKKVNPTSENIAKHIFSQLNCKLGVRNYRLREVTVWESSNSSATYYEKE